jgi:ketosteroid isomerase-like protein
LPVFQGVDGVCDSVNQVRSITAQGDDTGNARNRLPWQALKIRLILRAGDATICGLSARTDTMPQTYDTPQEAEDAYYDALEEGNLEQLLSVWADSDDICCLLPMYPMIQGRKGVEDVFGHLFSQGHGVELSVTHLGWIQTDDIAIHQVEENLQRVPPDTPPPPPFYGTNIYRKDTHGWQLIVHQNAPTPQPAPQE